MAFIRATAEAALQEPAIAEGWPDISCRRIEMITNEKGQTTYRATFGSEDPENAALLGSIDAYFKRHNFQGIVIRAEY